MQERDTINILISQLLCKDDEILSLRKQLENLRKEQGAGNALILEELDKSLSEQQKSEKIMKLLQISWRI